MKKSIIPRMVSCVMVLIILISSVPVTVFAQASDAAQSIDNTNDVTVEDDGGLGGLIATSIEELPEAEDVDVQNKILDVSVDGKIATVSFNNAVDCTIIVAVYDENTHVMLGSGIGYYAKDALEAEIIINIDEMPEYFVIKAFLLDSRNSPLHTSYVSEYYTEAHQEFLSASINDYSNENTINFDNSATNNFAVFADTTKLLFETETANQLILKDVENDTYVFDNADATISDLIIGDVFYYVALDETTVAGKVANISADGTTITIISEQDVALDEIFSFVKIDTESKDEETEVDMAASDESVTYEGSYSNSTYANAEVSTNIAHSFKFDKEFNDNVSLTGSLDLAVNVDLKIEVYWKGVSVELSLNEQADFEISLSGKLSKECFKVTTLKIPTGVAGVTLKVDVNFVIEASVTLSFTITQQSTIGFRLSSKSGYENTSKPSTCDTDLQLAGKVFVGLQLKPKVSALGIVEIGVSGELGLELEAETRNRVDTDEVKHLCATCTNGSVSFVCDFSVELTAQVFKWFKYEQKVTIWDAKIPLFDFYISSSLGFGKGECPNDEYLINFYVVDTAKIPVSGVAVDGQVTDSDGRVSAFFTNGEHKVSVSKTDYESQDYTFVVNGEPGNRTILLYRENEKRNYTWNPTEFGNVVYKGNNEGTTKVYFEDEHGWGASADVYAYTFKYLPAAGVDEHLGVWPGIKCDYEGKNIWSVDMPNACTHILFSYSGYTDVEDQTNDIPNPGKSVMAVRGTGYEYNGVMGYHPIYKWVEYDDGVASVGTDVIEGETEGATNEGAVVEESITIEDLVPGGVYALMVLKGGIENYTIDSESLMYITDEVANDSGTIDFTYYYNETDERWLVAVFGLCNHSVSDWEIVNEATLTKTGFKAKFCTKCSEVVEQEVIPVKQVTSMSLYECPELITGNDDTINNIQMRVKLDSGEYLYVYGSDCTIKGYDSSKSGIQYIDVTYYGFTKTITVNVTDRSQVYKDIYFTDIQSWNNVYVYYSGSVYETVVWPGVQMKYVETNSYGQKIYCASVPQDVTSLKFNDSTDITLTQEVSVTSALQSGMGWYPTNRSTSGKWNVDTFTYVSGEDNIPGSFKETIGTYTIYFDNYNGWSKVYAFTWNDENDTYLGEWPGTLCTSIGNNIWRINIPEDCPNIIFCSGISGEKTDNLIVPGDNYFYDNMHYWTLFDPSFTDVSEPDSEIVTIYFTKGNTWENAYIYGFYGEEGGELIAEWPCTYPGAPMTFVEFNEYGQSVYKAEVPADIDYIKFADGSSSNCRTDNAPNSLLSNNVGFALGASVGTNKWSLTTYIYEPMVQDTNPTEPTESTATDPVEPDTGSTEPATDSVEPPVTEPEEETGFTVVFLDYNGLFLDVQVVKSGDSATAPEVPTRKGYTFVGWDKELYNITSSTTIKAVYEKIPTTPTPAPTTGILKVEVVGGTSFTIAIDGGNARPQGPSYMNSKMPIGASVTVKANSASSAEFLGWQNSVTGVLLSTDPEYTFLASGNDSIKAIFAVKIEGVQMVTFKNSKAGNFGRVLDSQYYASSDAISFPDAPTQVGYDFAGWSMTEAEIQTAIANGEDVTVLATWTKALVPVEVTVNGGTGSGTYYANNAVTVTANEAEAGQKFAYWTDAQGNIRSYNAEYKFFPTADTTLTAVFVAEDEVIDYEILVSMDSIDTVSVADKNVFYYSWYCPEEYTFVKAGVVAVNKDNYNESTFTAGSSDSNVYDRSPSGTSLKPVNTYSWTKSNVTSGQTWMAKAYVQYKDAKGSIITVYSDVIEATKD